MRDELPPAIARSPRRLRREELPLNTIALARYLIGKTVVRELGGARLSGRIVETEAYLPDDPACHAFRGQTARNRSVFLERGHAYVYLIYGVYTMLNVAGDRKGVGAAVLIRALEPLEGVDQMARHRGGIHGAEVTRGPGRLAQALKIDLRHDGLDLCAEGPLWLGASVRRRNVIGASTRIGINVAADLVLRFFERGNPNVRGPKSLQAT